ncbi:TPA: ABC transporter [Escherichia coli]|uniref:TrlF family AAA-like ATPase n=2 Tax=Escherichia coli TaxID=562 RepID=UPI0015826D1F|nr:ABC transporter [Escherichia coli]EEZ7036012.1 ABC transporter [Escherichia coli O175]MCZ9245554.1 ABC transporter [Escherichia albertii]EFD4583253.1 ABC transporter [Escherichia coli]EFG8312098.1 ABC transporter [Escherichia coli]EGD6885323.1 ABC transporter [Escherichia coli]
MNWIGSRWWKFDFHNHTPASDDYGKGPNQAQYMQITHKDWLLNYMRQGIDCVAVTDHNSGAWIDPLKQALKELASESHEDYRPLYLFPGVELTVQGNIHILAIFGEDKTTSDIDSLLGAVRYRGTKGKSDGCSECSAVEVINEIARSGGLAIPAHVDQASGLFTVCTGNTLEQVLDNKCVFAMEVTDLAKAKPQLYIGKNLNWAEILGTDSHHPSGTGNQRYPGSHFTWVKMSEPSYDGLRLALVDGALSLKRSDNFTGDPNIHGQLAIESIVVDDAKYLGRGQSLTCQLNPWLNTIIGGRGTGKSTSLEFLRIALKRKGEIPKSLEKEFTKYSQTSKDRQDEGLLKDSTKITVGFRKDGGRFRITWSNTDDIYSIEEETAPGVWCASEGDIAQRFPVRIYSQKQIFELAKHPQALLQVVDDAPEVNHRDWQLKWDELVSKYLSLRAQEREVQAGLQEESVTKGQLEDVKRKLDVFEKAGHADVLKAYQLRQNQSKAMDSWVTTWEDSAEQVRDISGSLLPAELDLQYFDIGNADDKELFDTIKDIRATFEKLQTEMNSIAQRIDDVKNSWNQTRSDLGISKRITAASHEYNALLGQLSAADAGDPSAYGVLVKQRQDFEDKLKGFDKKRETLAQHQKSAEEYLVKLHEHRALITKLREDFLKDTLVGNSYVQINVIPFGNKITVEEEFRNLIGRSGGGFDRDIGVVDGDEGLLAYLTQDQSNTMDDKIEKIKSSLLAIHENDTMAVESCKDRRFVSLIQGLTPEQIDRIQCWFPGDSLDIRYSLKNGESFKPVEQGSPGQKTAALLAFILSYGNEPLILDQPEDDLDNHLIYDLIVTQLREIKQKRQVLVVTHNANIVVNGDAENVIALDIRSGQTRIVAQGGLQEPSIRDEICRVMEGGKEAFTQRYKRINAAIK